jgi:hypothetical protein
MMEWMLCAALYVTIPIVAMLISGRKVAWQGWVFFVALWPVAWLFMGPEELP